MSQFCGIELVGSPGSLIFVGTLAPTYNLSVASVSLKAKPSSKSGLLQEKVLSGSAKAGVHSVNRLASFEKGERWLSRGTLCQKFSNLSVIKYHLGWLGNK